MDEEEAPSQEMSAHKAIAPQAIMMGNVRLLKTRLLLNKQEKRKLILCCPNKLKLTSELTSMGLRQSQAKTMQD